MRSLIWLGFGLCFVVLGCGSPASPTSDAAIDLLCAVRCTTVGGGYADLCVSNLEPLRDEAAGHGCLAQFQAFLDCPWPATWEGCEAQGCVPEMLRLSRCIDGVPEDGAPAGAVCFTQDDCSAGLACTETPSASFVCQLNAGQGCSSDLDCVSGLLCLSSPEWASSAGDSTTGGEVCAVPGPTCVTDTDCTVGEVCAYDAVTEEGWCEPSEAP
jgi:hypothetical protein